MSQMASNDVLAARLSINCNLENGNVEWHCRSLVTWLKANVFETTKASQSTQTFISLFDIIIFLININMLNAKTICLTMRLNDKHTHVHILHVLLPCI